MTVPAAAPGIGPLLVGHWQAAWTVDVVLALYGGLYLWGVARVRGRWPAGRTAAFLAGLAAIVVATQSGVGTYDERLLSAHMVQHMLLLLVAPLLLAAGRPLILALRALAPARRAPLAALLSGSRRLTNPYACLAVFALVVLGTHLPSFYGATLRHPLLHDAEHVAYVGAGLLLWWPLLDGDPVPAHRLGGLGRLVYLLASMPAMAVVGALLDRAATPVYAGYVAPAHALGISAVADQQQAGAIMWVGGSSLMVAVGLWVAMAALVAEERRQRARELRAEQRGDAVGELRRAAGAGGAQA